MFHTLPISVSDMWTLCIGWVKRRLLAQTWTECYMLCVLVLGYLNHGNALKWIFLCAISLHAKDWLIYRISPNKRAGRRGRKRTLNLVSFQWNSQGGLLNSLPLSANNLIRIGSVVSEIWPVKVKSRGRVDSSKHVISAKYGNLKYI